jgi:hypothetical protein
MANLITNLFSHSYIKKCYVLKYLISVKPYRSQLSVSHSKKESRETKFTEDKRKMKREGKAKKQQKNTNKTTSLDT